MDLYKPFLYLQLLLFPLCLTTANTKVNKLRLAEGLHFRTYRIKKYKTKCISNMKKTWKLALAAFAIFAFTACSVDEPSSGTETEEGEVPTEDVELDLETDDSTILEDTAGMDGAINAIEEEQPPIQ